MPIGLVPVDDAAAVFLVDLHVDRTVHLAAVRYTRRLETTEDGVELFLTHAERIVDEWKRHR